MTWVGPSTVITGTLITASRWNQDVVANTQFLFDPDRAAVLHVPSSPYTRTVDSWADVDASNLALSVTSKGGPVWLGFSLTASVDNGSALGGFTLLVGGVNIGHSSRGLVQIIRNQAHQVGWSGYAVPGSGTVLVKLQFRSNSGHNLVVEQDCPVTMWAIAH